MKTSKERFTFKWLLVWSIIASILIFFTEFFAWPLIDLFSIFYFSIIELIVIISFLLSLAFSTFYAFTRPKYISPLLVNILGLILFAFLFKFNPYLYLNYYFYLNERGEFITAIEDGKFQIKSRNSSIQVPQEYGNISAGNNEVIISINEDGTLDVFFYTFRGIVDNYSGFLYRSNDSDPNVVPTLNNLNYFTKVKKIKENWFWVASN